MKECQNMSVCTCDEQNGHSNILSEEKCKFSVIKMMYINAHKFIALILFIEIKGTLAGDNCYTYVGNQYTRRVNISTIDHYFQREWLWLDDEEDLYHTQSDDSKQFETKILTNSTLHLHLLATKLTDVNMVDRPEHFMVAQILEYTDNRQRKYIHGKKCK